MKRTIYCTTAFILVLALAACSAPGRGDAPAIATANQLAAQDTAVQTADGLLAQIEQYKGEGNYEAVYQAALELIGLEPADAEAYIEAASALSEMSKANYAEIDRLLALGAENVQDVRQLSQWAEQNQPDISIQVPFSPDYSSPDEINVEGTTTGNMTNAAKYRNDWWQGGLLTWQGDLVYLAQPNEDFAIYKVRADGSGYQRLGDARGSSLNAVGDWLYYLDIQDNRPYKMRTDGSLSTKLVDEECSFLSVSGDFLYYGGDCLYRMRTDGSEKTALTGGLTIFPCVSGDYVYYAVKSETGGLWRVSVNGSEPQQVATGFIQTYCVVDDWIYYVDQSNWNNVWRVHTDGTDAGVILPFDFRITTINIADGILYLSFNVTNEEQDGFITGAEIVSLDIETLVKLQYVEADTEPLCTGPDGMLYFFRYSEGMAWYSMDQNGEVTKIG